jgi:hypothetical protein
MTCYQQRQPAIPSMVISDVLQGYRQLVLLQLKVPDVIL